MIEYLRAHNPDDRIIKKASDLIKQDHMVILQCCGQWVVVTRPESKRNIELLNTLKGIPFFLTTKLSSMVEYCLISTPTFREINSIGSGSHLFLFNNNRFLLKRFPFLKKQKIICFCWEINEVFRKLFDHIEYPLFCYPIIKEDFKQNIIEIYSGLIEDEFGSRVKLILDTGEELLPTMMEYDFSQQESNAEGCLSF